MSYTVNTAPCKRDLFSLPGVSAKLCGYATGYRHKVCPWCHFQRATEAQRHEHNQAKASVVALDAWEVER